MRDCGALITMSRSRHAIAHFACPGSAAAARDLLIAKGASEIDLSEGVGSGREPDHQLRVGLPSALERQLLGVLLASDAARVDVHDAD